MVEDNGPIHATKLSHVWHELKTLNLAHQTVTGIVELDGAIHKSVEDLSRERTVVPLAKPRISA